MLIIAKITEDQIWELYYLAKWVALGEAETQAQKERKLTAKKLIAAINETAREF